MSNEQLIEIGRKVMEKREAQRLYDKKYNARIKWANEQYKAFAIAQGFELPEMPEALR